MSGEILVKTESTDSYNCINEKEVLEIVDALREINLSNEQYEKLEKRLPWSVRIYPKIVLNHTGDWNKYRETIVLCNETYTWVRTTDLYSETGSVWNEHQAELSRAKFLKKVDNLFGKLFVKRICFLEKELLHFFPYERKLWNKIQSGILLTDEEIEKFVGMRSLDALLHTEIIRGFTGEDWSVPMVVCMKIKDISNDLLQYSKDLEAKLPNIYYMFALQEGLASSAKPKKITLYARDKVEQLKRSILSEVENFDFRNCSFLEDEINFLYRGEAA